MAIADIHRIRCFHHNNNYTEYVERSLAAGHRPAMGLIILHSVLASALVALGIEYAALAQRPGWSVGTSLSVTLAILLAVGITATLRSRMGLQALRFVTLVPVVLAIAVIVGLDAPELDRALSARPVAAEIGQLETKRLPLAVLGVSRELEYGLAFYSQQTIQRYDSGQVPAAEHLLIAKQGSEIAIGDRVPGRRVFYLGGFAPQKLNYYWVAGKQDK